ncbi:hypothetical protein EST38_g12583 [Candolleomyces aberdarensis]|uniref:Uncharacterized protein n=1 Tax=Candolleomyces aberdarensis TaxID=2316362 RepID=A0A4Q2D2U3_9AGAR|nr:hypothetical protein EST38_g12583 [Candolleomyces aberdarensis]
MIRISPDSAEATLWVCLYALLGAKTKYFVVLVGTYMVLTIPNYITLIMNSIVYAGEIWTLIELCGHIKLTMGIHRNLGKARPASAFDKALGYACYLFPSPRYRFSRWFTLARTMISALLVIFTLVFRYRQQKGSLIKVIRRDGGVYYLSNLAVRLATSIQDVPGFPVRDPYYTTNALLLLVVPIFANSLLLNLKKLDDAGPTRRVISTILFEKDRRDESSTWDIDDGATRSTEDTAVERTNTIEA